MTRKELAFHYKSGLKQSVGFNDRPAILAVLNNILNEAIAVLEPWINNVERPGLCHMEPGSRTIRIESATNAPWNLCDPDDAYQFNLCANLPDPIKPAAYLARLCTGVIKQGVIKPNSFTIEHIIEAYRCLDEAEGINQKIDANKSRTNKFAKIENDLKAYWKKNIPRTKLATEAAILLEKTSIYELSPTKPKRSSLERYIRKWQAEPE